MISQTAAINIIEWFHNAEQDLVGATVVTFNGETGAVRDIKLDEHHGLCFTFDHEDDPPRRFYPVSTIRTQS